MFSDHISIEVSWLLDYMTSEDEAQEKLDEIEKIVARINALGLDYKADTREFNFDWYDVAMNNEFDRQMAKDD